MSDVPYFAYFSKKPLFTKGDFLTITGKMYQVIDTQKPAKDMWGHVIDPLPETEDA